VSIARTFRPCLASGIACLVDPAALHCYERVLAFGDRVPARVPGRGEVGTQRDLILVPGLVAGAAAVIRGVQKDDAERGPEGDGAPGAPILDSTARGRHERCPPRKCKARGG
jgi:hypothetical protein